MMNAEQIEVMRARCGEKVADTMRRLGDCEQETWAVELMQDRVDLLAALDAANAQVAALEKEQAEILGAAEAVMAEADCPDWLRPDAKGLGVPRYVQRYKAYQKARDFLIGKINDKGESNEKTQPPAGQ